MNERIKELVTQAGFTANDPEKVFLRVYEQELNELVGLIVRECVSSIPLDMDSAEYLKVMRAVKQTFKD